jgi:hypothetical protein
MRSRVALAVLGSTFFCLLSSCNPDSPSAPVETPSFAASVFHDVRVESFAGEVLFDACTQELVTLSGVLRVQEQESFTPPEGHHQEFRILIHGSGVGATSGLAYQWQVVHRLTFNFDAAHTLTETDNALLIAQGSASKALIHILIHITRNAVGEIGDIAVSFDKESGECRGPIAG